MYCIEGEREKRPQCIRWPDERVKQDVNRESDDRRKKRSFKTRHQHSFLLFFGLWSSRHGAEDAYTVLWSLPKTKLKKPRIELIENRLAWDWLSKSRSLSGCARCVAHVWPEKIVSFHIFCSAADSFAASRQQNEHSKNAERLRQPV